MKKTFLTLAVLVFTPILFSQNLYQFDKNHARLTFIATHFGISHVEGNFKDFNVSLKSKMTDFSDAVIEVTAQVNTLDTDNDTRDNDLKSSKWFDVEKYPAITFKSTALKKQEGNNYKLEGNITMHGITKPIVLDVIYNGKALNPMTKKNIIGFTVNGKLNRGDFDIGTDAFSSVVGKEIEIRSDVEFTQIESMASK